MLWLFLLVCSFHFDAAESLRGCPDSAAGKHNPSTVFIWLMKAYFFCNIFCISINQLGRQLRSKIRMFLLPHLISFSPTLLFRDTICMSAPSVFPFPPALCLAFSCPIVKFPRLFTATFCLYPRFHQLVFFLSLHLSCEPIRFFQCISHTISLILVFICLSLAHLHSVYLVWFHLHENQGTHISTGSPSQRHSPHGCLCLISSFKDFSPLIFLPGRGCSFLGYLLMLPAFIFSLFLSTVIRHTHPKFPVHFVLFSYLFLVPSPKNK